MQAELTTLYIYDSKGRARQWSVTTDDDVILVTYGLVDGKKVTKRTKAKAKNIGKVNETTPAQQALLEAQSKWNFQIEREDYHENIELSALQLRPMLALDYNKVPHRVDWLQAVSQPKLDGLRLVVGNRVAYNSETRQPLLYDDTAAFEMLTRKGETYHVPHMIKPCDILIRRVNELVNNRCLALDGEAYLHGLPLQQITSRAKKYKKGLTEQLEFHIFDLVIPNMSFKDRHAVLIEATKSCDYDKFTIKFVDYDVIDTEEYMKFMHGIYALSVFA